MRVTRVKRARYLAAVKPGGLRDGLTVRLTASQEEQVVHAESTVPAAPGLVWLTVTEVTRLWPACRTGPLARGRDTTGARVTQRRFACRRRPNYRNET